MAATEANFSTFVDAYQKRKAAAPTSSSVVSEPAPTAAPTGPLKVASEGINDDDLIAVATDAGAEDIDLEDDYFVISGGDRSTVAAALRAHGFRLIENGEVVSRSCILPVLRVI